MRRSWLGAGLMAFWVSICCHVLPADDWARFRGPNGSGVSPDPQPAPVTWRPTENLKWKIALPGPGSSSPIVVGERVYITCWSGYAMTRDGDPGDQSQLKRHLICIDRKDGSIVWDKTVPATLPEDPYGGMFAEHGYASHTPVSDGKRIYAFFGKSGVVAFDLDGNILWTTPVGTESDPRGWGSASSPILSETLVIVPATAESEAIVALDADTGKEVWRQEAGGFSGTWGTPVLVSIDDQRTDLVIGIPGEIWGFNPKTGKLAWYCTSIENNSYCSSVVTDGQMVYAVEGRPGGSIAVRAGGSGDVTQSHVVWTGRDMNRIGTPVVHEGKIYFLSAGIANCIDAATGKKIYQERLAGNGAGDSAAGGNEANPGNPPRQGGPGEGAPGQRGPGRRGGGGGRGGQDYSSPVVAAGKLYYVSRAGEAYVIKLGETYEKLAVNRVTTDREDFSGTPALSRGELVLRSDKHLYCIAVPGT